MAGCVGIIVQVVDPGAFHRSHIVNKVIYSRGVIAELQDAVLHAWVVDGKFIDIDQGIGV